MSQLRYGKSQKEKAASHLKTPSTTFKALKGGKDNFGFLRNNENQADKKKLKKLRNYMIQHKLSSF